MAKNRKFRRRPPAEKSGPGGSSSAKARSGSGRASSPTSGRTDRAAKIAAAGRPAARAERRRRMLLVLTGLILVAVIVAVVVVVKISDKPAGKVNAATSADASITKAVTGVPATTLDSVGVGSVTKADVISQAFKPLTGSPLTASGKPRVLYVGAEFCPYCAAMRWPLAVALSRFGTLQGLGVTKSSATDENPNTPTLDFKDATYSSSTISLTAKEVEDGEGKPLQTLGSADQQLFQSVGQGGFPFIDIGGRYQVSTSYDGKILAGMTQAQIAAKLSDAGDPVAKAIDGSANLITAAICARTKNQPANVCTSAGVKAATAKLP